MMIDLVKAEIVNLAPKSWGEPVFDGDNVQLGGREVMFALFNEMPGLSEAMQGDLAKLYAKAAVDTAKMMMETDQ